MLKSVCAISDRQRLLGRKGSDEMNIKQAAKRGPRAVSAALLAAAFAVPVPLNALAQTANASCGSDLPLSGTFTFTGQTVGYVVGVRWGKGTLTLLDGTEIPISATGAKAFELGASAAEIEGEVYGLTEPSDLVGQYVGQDRGFVPLQSNADLVLVNNEVCVVIAARVSSQGGALSLPTGQSVTVQLGSP